MKITRKSFRGYAESAVREELQRRQDDHRLRMRGLEEELQTLREDNAKLREELESLERQQQPVPEAARREEPFRRQAAEKLLQAHIEQSGSVWEAMEQLRELNRQQDRELERQRDRRGGILESIESKMRETLEGLGGEEVT